MFKIVPFFIWALLPPPLLNTRWHCWSQRLTCISISGAGEQFQVPENQHQRTFHGEFTSPHMLKSTQQALLSKEVKQDSIQELSSCSESILTGNITNCMLMICTEHHLYHLLSIRDVGEVRILQRAQNTSYLLFMCCFIVSLQNQQQQVSARAIQQVQNSPVPLQEVSLEK